MTAPHCVCQASALLCSALLTRPRVWCRAITSFVVGRPPYKSNFYCHPGRAGGTPMLLGLLLHAIVHPADVQDRDGGILLLATLCGMYPFLKKLFAGAAYEGAGFLKVL